MVVKVEEMVKLVVVVDAAAAVVDAVVVAAGKATESEAVGQNLKLVLKVHQKLQQ